MPFPSTSVLDDFLRANQGPPPSANWTTVLGGHQVFSNECEGSVATADSLWSNASFAASQEVYCTLVFLPSNGQSLKLYGRCQASNSVANCYFVQFTPTLDPIAEEVKVYKTVAGVNTQLGSTFTPASFALGDVLGARFDGNAIEVFINGISIGTTTDSTFTGASYIGIGTTDLNAALDNFGGGAVSTVRVWRNPQRIMKPAARTPYPPSAW